MSKLFVYLFFHSSIILSILKYHFFHKDGKYFDASICIDIKTDFKHNMNCFWIEIIYYIQFACYLILLFFVFLAICIYRRELGNLFIHSKKQLLFIILHTVLQIIYSSIYDSYYFFQTTISFCYYTCFLEISYNLCCLVNRRGLVRSLFVINIILYIFNFIFLNIFVYYIDFNFVKEEKSDNSSSLSFFIVIIEATMIIEILNLFLEKMYNNRQLIMNAFS